MTNKPVLIYGLFDPREPDHIRYVGKTNSRYLSSPYVRHRTCLNQPKSQWNRKHHWIKSLNDAGVKLGIIHLFTTDEQNWALVERTTIQFYRAEGHDLTNKHRGGKTDFYDVAYDPIPKEEWYAKWYATRISREGENAFKRDPESVQRGLETKRANGTWHTSYTPEFNAKRWETRRKNGTDKPTQEAIAKQLETKAARGIVSVVPDAARVACVSKEAIAKREATKREKRKDPEYRAQVAAKSAETKSKNPNNTNMCIIDGVEYESVKAAYEALGTTQAGLYGRKKRGLITMQVVKKAA